MYTVEITSRLVQIRLVSPLDGDGLARFIERTRFVLLTTEDKVVTIADLRRWTVMSPDSADMIATMLVRNSPKVDRTAILVSSLQSSVAMQFVRLIRATRSQVRRVFDRTTDAVDYLNEGLTLDERSALEGFLAAL